MTRRPAVRVAALVVRGEELLMTRTGHGPAGGTWDVPRVTVDAGEMLAEAVVRSIEECCGYPDALCGPFAGWQEDLHADAGPVDPGGHAPLHGHHVTMFFHAVLLDGMEPDPQLVTTTDEVRWVSTYQVPDLRTRDGLAEFLSDQSMIDTVL